MRKTCYTCKKKKLLDLFYFCKSTTDKHLGECKSCVKKRVRARYYNPEKRDMIIAYEKKRFKSIERKKKLKLYRQKRKTIHSGKAKVKNRFDNAIRDKKITRLPCEVCGNEKAQGH